MALAEARLVGAEDEWHMGKLRQLLPEGLIELNLARRIATDGRRRE